MNLSTQLHLILPEIVMMVMVCVVLLVGLFSQHKEAVVFYLTLATLVIAAFFSMKSFSILGQHQALYAFDRSFILDKLSIILKLFIYASVFFTFIYSRAYNRDRGIPALEFYVLGLFSTLGMMVLVSSHSLLTLYLGMELLALPTYAMVALRRNHEVSIEAGMKYFVIGAVASGMMLYGLSLLFGATHSLDMTVIATKHLLGSTHIMYIIGLVFVIVGIAFKLGAAPFHMWVPDVYQGAPTSVTLFIAGAAKLAAFALAIRLLSQTLPGMILQWQMLLIVISILSMAIGNIAAIIQSNLKRMLAYSSIAHMGYMLLGLLCATPRGYSAALFYTITYTLMTLAAFGMILLLSRVGFEAEDIEDFSGLNNKHPWLALMMLIVMFSLAGIPPLVGFMAKVGVLEALIQVHLVWLAVAAILFAVIGSYYYLRVVKVMYFEKTDHVREITCSTGVKVVLSVNSLLVLVVGIFPAWLFHLSHMAFFH